MLSAADNELITRVGPGTPGGDMMRQYWMPILDRPTCPRPTPARCGSACSART